MKPPEQKGKEEFKLFKRELLNRENKLAKELNFLKKWKEKKKKKLCRWSLPEGKRDVV